VQDLIYKNSYQPILGFFSLNLIHYYEITIKNKSSSIKLPDFEKKNEAFDKLKEEDDYAVQLNETLNIDNPSTPLLKKKQKDALCFEMKVKLFFGFKIIFFLNQILGNKSKRTNTLF
jgi:hypothetical protein